MSSRRRFLLPLLFLGSAVVLVGPLPARGQPRPRPQWPPPPPPPLSNDVSVERVKEFLARINGGQLPPDLQQYADLLQQLQKQYPGLIEQAKDKLQTDPAFRERANKEVERLQKDPTAVPDLGELGKLLPKSDVPPRLSFDPEKVGPKFQPDRGPPKGRKGQPPEGFRPQPKDWMKGEDRPRRGDFPKTDPRDVIELGKRFGNAFDPRKDSFADLGKSADQLMREKRMEAAAALWERNVGPLDETPAVRRALFDLVAGSDDLVNADGKGLWDLLDKDAVDGASFADWVDKAAEGGSWKLPSLDLGSTSFGRWWSGSSNVDGGGSSSSGRWSAGDRSSSRWGGPSGSGSMSFGGLEGSWLPVILLAVIVFGGLIWWRFWYLRDPSRVGDALPDWLGPWPVDPRRIATREDLVRAFEYLSVLICGKEARTWTHGTIARALSDLAATHLETARLLARLYELARYAPLDEPLTPEELAEGRRLVCQLAGVSAA
jgi:hypothetical protein